MKINKGPPLTILNLLFGVVTASIFIYIFLMLLDVIKFTIGIILVVISSLLSFGLYKTASNSKESSIENQELVEDSSISDSDLDNEIEMDEVSETDIDLDT